MTFPSNTSWQSYGTDRAYDRCQHGTARLAGRCRACDEEAARALEDLTPEGVQLVIPGCEKVAPATAKQGELW